MARQATLDGLHIELLVLFDTELAGVLPALPRKRTPLLKVLRNRWCRLVGAGLSLGRRVERDVVRGRDETQYTQECRSFDRVQRINETAAKRYRLNPYPGVVTYFAVRTRETAMFDALRTATGCTVDVADIPGNHMTMLEPPNVAKVADELHRRLARSAPEHDLNHRRQRE
jgi:thioesterase domain-containing protein